MPDSSADVAILRVRLMGLLNSAHALIGVDPEPLTPAGSGRAEYHELSPAGVLAFVDDYLLVAWPDDEQAIATPRAIRLISRQLRARGELKIMAHPRNFRSVKATRKMGAKPLGVDADGFVHYLLLSSEFPYHGQEVESPAAP